MNRFYFSSRRIFQSSFVHLHLSRFLHSSVPESHFSADVSRLTRLQNSAVKPFSDFLTDTFQRQHDYLRISVTERCNLRCLYCMPEEGVPLSPPRNLLTTPEIVMLSTLFVAQGVRKIRLTGGEPTVRRDIVPLIQQLGSLQARGLQELCLTTNGIALHRKLDALVAAGLTGVNLSLDTLDPLQFQIMTRRKGFDTVQRSIQRILEMKAAGAQVKLKVNCVVMRGLNDEQILPFVNLTRHNDLEVRFIEYMPFDGNRWNKKKMISYADMLDVIRTKYPDVAPVRGHLNDTSKTWQVPGHIGRLGFITSMTHNFCGTCNRLRITSDGNLKVCLFGNTEVSLRDIIRKVNSGEPIDEDALAALQSLAGGLDAPKGMHSVLETVQEELLEVIGRAVKRKKEKHAGIGQLEHMKNRPMILIDSSDSRDPDSSSSAHLTHVSASGAAHMVPIAHKLPTQRTAIAACRVLFSSSVAPKLIATNAMKKGDVLATARIAGIMAAKRTPEIIPLCHPLMLSQVAVDLQLNEDDRAVDVRATVACEGKTGVEMEALTAAGAAALTVYDMCKAVDRGMVVDGLRVVLKEGGKSGRWEME
ncbi:hypothetical protein TD95_002974 [Thielaviopsis punctulata]|uniref:Radical SAM core domain-containing protein n=1 Tax=Thielaviopsis punctulata TaxID=72032 RepID=A0A0F4ZK94_9PEZI|nr:hypothetical protein TD95_002974 [Thielaviopsis punctulata]